MVQDYREVCSPESVNARQVDTATEAVAMVGEQLPADADPIVSGPCHTYTVAGDSVRRRPDRPLHRAERPGRPLVRTHRPLRPASAGRRRGARARRHPGLARRGGHETPGRRDHRLRPLERAVLRQPVRATSSPGGEPPA
ncbi:hypothetical protein [Nocardioides sp. B-3]|uniref:hypothetical protein n=1 Tax=Nocardioides sp. B-3 TaxID=2895565 RepID=UPI0021527222|nr:hypothetical protein [Nocardioides sp. B-3]UUZ61503.1 hypothetical protein LP418_13635 [Nocardioides sp. B-3]